MEGLIGKKIGMTSVFDENGQQIPVTVIECGPCVVLQRKTAERDGYDAAVLGFGEQKESRTRKPQLARYKKLDVAPRRFVREFRVDAKEDVQPGATVSVKDFEGVGYVDIAGITKGRGFQGVVKRYRMGGGPKTHGGQAKRRPGSVGCCETPARIYKGRKMPGHMGHVMVSQQNLRVVGIMDEDNLLLVQGGVPGPAGGILLVRKSIKKGGKSK